MLADSSIVTLALPEVLRQFDTSVFGVSWVLTAFNVFLFAAVAPAARIARPRPARTWIGGLLVFSLASLACALAPSIAVLIAARCAQALGGAAVVAGAIELLAGARGSHQAAAGMWGLAGLAGLAGGPAIGGLLTEVLSWQAIFALQVPLLLLAPSAVGLRAAVPRPGPRGLAERAPEISLGLLSAGLTGALFLLVVMLTEGWTLSPLAAGLVVSIMPAATVAARAAEGRLGGASPVVAAGALLIGGGLASLALLPGAAVGWTVAPQALIGVGIALTLPGLTDRALAGRDPRGERAAGTIAARHAGIVLGLIVLTPIFSAQLDSEREATSQSTTSLLLDAELSPGTKIALGGEIADALSSAEGRLPTLDPAFQAVEPDSGEETELERLESAMKGEVEKAATHAFHLPFLLAAALSLLALVPLGRWRE